MPALIELEDVHFSYRIPNSEPVSALVGIDLEIREGEFFALIGANGSGKSTLAKMVNALLIPDSGRVIVGGLVTKNPANRPKIRSLAGMIFQRPQDQIVATTVWEDVSFGPGNMKLPPDEIRIRVKSVLEETGLSHYKDRASYQLSAGETQRLALAGVLAMRPACIIFDETTAMLDPAGRKMVMEQAKRLHSSGHTIIFITHLMEEAVEAERVITLGKGKVILDGSPAEVFSQKKILRDAGLDLPPAGFAAEALKKFMPGISEDFLTAKALISQIPSYEGAFSPAQKSNNKLDVDQIIEVSKLSHEYMRNTPNVHAALKDVSMEVGRNTVHGLIGPTGSGKTTLLQHLNGLLKPQAGKVIVDGQNLSDPELDLKALRRTVGLSFQQPEDQIFEQYAGDEIAYAPRNLGVEENLADTVRDAMEAVGLDFEAYKDRLTATLSGGEKRKVALASVLAAKPEILLLDEPTAGLDPQARSEITNHLMGLKKERLSMVISTHQYEELAGMMDRTSILADGKSMFVGRPGKVFTHKKMLEKHGLELPLAVRIAEGMRQKGWPIPKSAVSLPQLLDEMRLLTEGKR